MHSSDLLFFLWFVWFVNCCNEGLEEEDEQMPDQHFEPLEEAIDPFLAALNAQCIGPGDYAAELVVNSTLNRQQILAVAPIALGHGADVVESLQSTVNFGRWRSH